MSATVGVQLNVPEGRDELVAMKVAPGIPKFQLIVIVWVISGSALLSLKLIGVPGQATAEKAEEPLIPVTVGKLFEHGFVQTSISLTTVPIRTPFLYSFTKMSITPTSIAVGFITMSPFGEREIGGEDEIGFVAE